MFSTLPKVFPRLSNELVYSLFTNWRVGHRNQNQSAQISSDVHCSALNTQCSMVQLTEVQCLRDVREKVPQAISLGSLDEGRGGRQGVVGLITLGK